MRAEAVAHLQEHYEDLEKQTHAATLGMWIFLCTEILLFGGLFVSYAVYRYLFPAEFAQGSEHLNLTYGTVNTYILITSSLSVALATAFAKAGRHKLTALMLVISICFGLAFMGVKAAEYLEHFREGALPGRYIRMSEVHGAHVPGVSMFMALYFLMTGLHAIHVTVGLGVLSTLAVFSWRGAYGPAYHTPVELGGLYWHLVDLIWIFLYPLLYLVS